MPSIIPQSIADYNFEADDFAASQAKSQHLNCTKKDFTDYWDEQWQILNDNFDSLIERLDITPTNKSGKCRCPNPDHPDRHPSAQINRDKFNVYCHTCGCSWGAKDLITLVTGINSPKECLDYGLNLVGKPRRQGMLAKSAETQTAGAIDEGADCSNLYIKLDGLHPTESGCIDSVNFDKAYREYAASLGLMPAHRQFLKDKYKLNDSQIDDGLFFGVRSGQDLSPLPVPKADGILIPYWQDGKVVGAQIRTSSKDCKYIWLGENRQSAIIDNEVPLTILPGINAFQHPTYLIEGGLKSFLFWLKSGRQATVIGAAGGLFHSKQLTGYIAQNPHKPLCFLPDADTIKNKAVYARVCSQIRAIRESGYERIYIGDFGQLTGNQPDPDEWIESHPDKTNWKKDLAMLGAAKFTGQSAGNDSKDFDKWQRQFVALDGCEYLDVPEGQWFSDIVPLPKNGDFLMLTPPTGTGKTHYLHRIKEQCLKEMKGIVLVAPTENAARQAAQELGIHYYQDFKDTYYLDNPDVSVALCIASLHLLQGWHFDNRVVVFDEITASIRQLKDFKELLKGTRELSGESRYQAISDNFKSAIKCSDICIGLDAFLANIHLEWLKKQSNKQVKIYSVKHEIRGTINVTSDMEVLLEKFNEVVSKNSRISFSSDSRKATQEFAEKYAKKFPESTTTLINSRTLQDDKSLKDFVASPTAKLEEWESNLFSYSPSMLTGGDVQSVFDYQFAELNGVVEPDLLCQQPRRCRNVSERYYYIPEKSLIRQELEVPNALIAQWSFRVNSEDFLVSNADLEFFARLEWGKRFTSKNLRKCVEAMLNRDGYEINDFSPEKLEDEQSQAPLSIARSDAIKRITQNEFKQLAAVTIPDEKELEKLEALDKQTSIESDKVYKAKIAKQLPGIPAELLASPEFLYFFQEMRGALITRWLVMNSGDARVIEWQGAIYSGKKVAPQLFKNYWLEAQILGKLGVLNLPEEFTGNSLEVSRLCEKVRNSQDAKLGLRISNPPKSNIKLLRMLLAKCGKSLYQCKVVKGTRYYSVCDGGMEHIKNPDDWAVKFDREDERPAKMFGEFLTAIVSATNQWQMTKMADFTASQGMLAESAETETGSAIDEGADCSSLYINLGSLHPTESDPELAKLSGISADILSQISAWVLDGYPKNIVIEKASTLGSDAVNYARFLFDDDGSQEISETQTPGPVQPVADVPEPTKHQASQALSPRQSMISQAYSLACGLSQQALESAISKVYGCVTAIESLGDISLECLIDELQLCTN